MTRSTISLILLSICIVEYHASNLFLQSDIEISDSSKQFQPANMIELLNSISTSSLFDCAQMCNFNTLCRTFDYDSSTSNCRLFEGAVNTGSIIASGATSQVGFLRFFPQFYAAYNQSCDQCEQHRYLVCSNGSCRCPSHTFWNGIQCENQRYFGASCNQLDSCRSDIPGLQCTSYGKCWNSTNPPPIVEWSFDRNLNDTYGIYNGISTNGIVQWMSPGYAGYGQAAYFANKTYSRVTNSLKLIDISFTISAWINLLSNVPLNSSEFGIFTHCEDTIPNKCLYLSIRYGKLFCSLNPNTMVGSTSLKSNVWYHVAYIYDRSTLTQSIYLNGQLDGTLPSSGIFQSNASEMWIGASPYTNSYPNPFAYMDEMIIVPRIKTASELLEEATLVAYYPFDNSFIDAGPNKISNTSGINVQFNSNGRVNQALVLDSNYSVFETTGLFFLGQSDYPYSFALWIYPFATKGILIQLFSNTSLWWSPMLGFDNTSHLVTQTWNGWGFYNVALQSFILPLKTWTHVAATFSVTNGLRLFVNGILVNMTSSSYAHSASGSLDTMSVGTCANISQYHCTNPETRIVPSQFRGQIDELRIYSRELTITDIAALVNV